MEEDRYVTRPPAVAICWSTTLCVILLLSIYVVIGFSQQSTRYSISLR